MAASIESREGFTPIDQLPSLYLQSVVAVEDHRFFAHPGFDAIATGRALVNDLKAGAIVEGGSTITQQLAKNQFFTQEQTLERKVAEVFMALNIERHFSKSEILELYVNSIYFGDGYEGVGRGQPGLLRQGAFEPDRLRSHAVGGRPERALGLRPHAESRSGAPAAVPSARKAGRLRLPVLHGRPAHRRPVRRRLAKVCASRPPARKRAGGAVGRSGERRRSGRASMRGRRAGHATRWARRHAGACRHDGAQADAAFVPRA